MWRLILVLCSLILSVPVNADWYFEPGIGLQVSSRLEGEDRLTEELSVLKIKTEYDSDKLTFKLDGDFRYNNVYHRHQRYSQAAEDEYKQDHRLNSGYVTTPYGDWLFTLGYQKVAWGEADELRVVDVVNPLDLRDFVLLDLDTIKIAQPLLKAGTSLTDDMELDLYWLFEFEPNKLSPAGSEFTFQQVVPGTKRLPNGSEFGAKLSLISDFADIGFYYLNGYSDTAVYKLENFELAEEYPRQSMYGMSISKPFAGLVARGELAVYPDMTFNTRTAIPKESTAAYALFGLDYLVYNWLFSMQLTDRCVKEWDENFLEPEHDLFYTFSVSGDTYQNRLRLRLATTESTANGDGSLRQVKLSYVPNKHWTFQFNLDFLSGASDNFFGQFSDNDRFMISAIYKI